MINGEIVTKPALSEIEIMNFDKVGNMEAINTDGLRSILFTMNHITNMKEKTLRYSGHAALMANYRNAGKFDKDQISKTSDKLFTAWRLEENEPELTVMKIIIDGDNECINEVTKDSKQWIEERKKRDKLYWKYGKRKIKSYGCCPNVLQKGTIEHVSSNLSLIHI